MTRGAALLLAMGFAAAAFLYGGVWQYGDGFIFNRFNGEVIYVDLPESEESVRLGFAAATGLGGIRAISSARARPGRARGTAPANGPARAVISIASAGLRR